MRFPQIPPDVSSLLQGIAPDRLMGLFVHAREWEKREEYHHWDKFRRLPIPDGVSHEELWCGIRMRRMSDQKEVPLKDKRGRGFSYNITDRILQQLHVVDLGAGGQVWGNNPIPAEEDRQQYLVRSLVQEAITSSQLEGAATTREVAQKMLREGRKPKNQGERMILNNYHTMRQICHWKEEALTPELVCRVHRMVTEGTLENANAAGRMRLPGENITVQDALTGEVFHEPPPAEELASRMKAMCAFANGETPGMFVHPALRAVILHFWLAYDHPFVDGNGRTARALFYWAMLRAGYWLFQYISISEILLQAPSKYAQSFLYTETDNNDLTYFILYQIEVIERALAELSRYMEKKTTELRQMELLLHSNTVLNHRQQALLLHALKHPGEQYTIKGHQNSHQIAYGTARNDLEELARQGVLDMRKSGKRFVYIAPHDLATRLKGE